MMRSHLKASLVRLEDDITDTFGEKHLGSSSDSLIFMAIIDEHAQVAVYDGKSRKRMEKLTAMTALLHSLGA